MRDLLADSPSDRAWARVVSSELAPLAGDKPLPEIPVQRSAPREPEGAAGPPTQPAAAAPARAPAAEPPAAPSGEPTRLGPGPAQPDPEPKRRRGRRKKRDDGADGPAAARAAPGSAARW